ncbi:MAG TPA: glycosyltransferase [Thermoanaerobaculia bacterium]
MHLCYVADTQVPSRTANSIHVMKMGQAYRRLGHRVTLVVPAWRGGVEAGVADVFAYYGLSERFRIVRVPHAVRLAGRGYFGLLLPAVAALLRPDLVHTRNLAVAWGCARLLRRPTVLELHDVPGRTPRQRAVFRAVSASPATRAVVTITDAQRRLVEPLAAPGARLVVAPDGVDAAWLDERPTREEARRELGLEGEARRVAVYTGHLYRGRGIGLILELARRAPDHLFLIVGGREEDVERRRREAAGLPNVRVVGFQPPARVPLYLRAADVLLMPYADAVETTGGSDTAAFASPLKLFEYLAAGRPVLASQLPVLGEVLRDGDNALLLPYADAAAWLAALAGLAARPELADSLAASARRDAAGFTWERRAEAVLAAAGRGG